MRLYYLFFLTLIHNVSSSMDPKPHPLPTDASFLLSQGYITIQFSPQRYYHGNNYIPDLYYNQRAYRDATSQAQSNRLNMTTEMFIRIYGQDSFNSLFKK